MTHVVRAGASGPSSSQLSSHQPDDVLFGDGEIAGLPTAVQRYFRCAIAPDTALTTCVALRMRGSIKLGRWLPFEADEVLNPHEGFVWRARAARVIGGSDRYLAGAGAMRWRLGGLVTVVSSDGVDVSRSAAGRAAGEAIWVPSSLLPRFGVAWTALDDCHISAHFRVHDVPVELRLVIDGTGRVTSFALDRWGDPDRSGSWGWHSFGGEVTGYLMRAGMRIPSAGQAGWGFGTDEWPRGEFLRYAITSLQPVRSLAD